MTAAYFAVSELPDKDAILYALDIPEMAQINTDPFSILQVASFYPTGHTALIVSQHGLFTISGQPDVSLENTTGISLKGIRIPKEGNLVRPSIIVV